MTSQISEKVIEKFGADMIAGVFFDHTQDFKIVIRTTKKGQKSRDVLKFASENFPELQIEVIPNSPRNFRAIENIINNQAKVLSKKIAGFQSLGYNPATDKLVLSIYDPSAKDASELIEKYKIDKLSGMEVEVQLLSSPIATAALMGGVEMQSIAGRCTAGFGVRGENNQPGVVTAYHCTNNGTEKNYVLQDHEGARHMLTLQTPKPSANHDMAVYLAPVGTALNARYNKHGVQGSEPEFVRSQGKRTDLKIGQSYVCHSGVKTGFSCGTISGVRVTVLSVDKTKKVGDEYLKACNTAQDVCNATFVSFSGPALRCASGDSGGPVINGSIAYGITSGCSAGTVTKDGNPVIYASSLDYLSELPAKLALAP
ncbi:hypothetical protein B0181_10240 [Moraxella caviae]|uniref:Alpha-lytic protease n=1 Tax=Moraxella caviae TaxID=34060 RepID=A0A1S9ZVN4_9GAMM|nr:S1 family peptidase [Moraxella caviae]OOR87473.1 hypothetical protein B0181_10240 [Moraxella caviae]STZ10626.1 Alpha-lytic protease precursor [Moraxella caviae]